jgi:hypothetical protein
MIVNTIGPTEKISSKLIAKPFNTASVILFSMWVYNLLWLAFIKSNAAFYFLLKIGTVLHGSPYIMLFATGLNNLVTSK